VIFAEHFGTSNVVLRRKVANIAGFGDIGE